MEPSSPASPSRSTSSGSMDDDFSGSAPPSPTQHWARLSSTFTNDGYREGILEGKLSSLQEGFDSGYVLSLSPARNLGRQRALASSLVSYLSPRSASSKAPRPDVDGEARDRLLSEAKALAKELSRLQMEDLVSRDLEAEAHAKEHGEEETGSAAGRPDDEKAGARKMEDLEGRVTHLLDQVGLSAFISSLPSGGLALVV